MDAAACSSCCHIHKARAHPQLALQKVYRATHESPACRLAWNLHLLYGLIRSEGDAQDGPQHFAELDDLVDGADDDVHRDSKPHATVGARRRVYRCVDACMAAFIYCKSVCRQM